MAQGLYLGERYAMEKNSAGLPERTDWLDQRMENSMPKEVVKARKIKWGTMKRRLVVSLYKPNSRADKSLIERIKERGS